MAKEKEVIEICKENMEELIPTPVLNIPGIKEEKAYIPKGMGKKQIGYVPYIVVECETVALKDAVCPSCGKHKCTPHGYMPNRRLLHDSNQGITSVDISLNVRRYICSCGITFTPKIDSILENKQFTARAIQAIQRAAFERTFSEVADDYGTSIPTIEAIFDEYASNLNKQRVEIECPIILGIDEKYIANQARAVFVDVQNGNLLEMRPANKYDDIVETIISFKNWETNLKVITTDMNVSYKSYIYKNFPYITLVVDHYHVIQDLESQIKKIKTKITEHVNEKIAHELNAETKNRMKAAMRELSKSPYLFLFNGDKIRENEYLRVLMADICSLFPEYNHLRQIKEVFEDIYKCTDRTQAEAAYKCWTELVPPTGKKRIADWEEKYHVSAELFSEMRVFSKTVDRWHDEIFNFFEVNCRYTNAAAEGNNNNIDKVNRIGGGYTFTRLRSKVLYHDVAAPRIKYRYITAKNGDKKKHSTVILNEFASSNLAG